MAWLEVSFLEVDDIRVPIGDKTPELFNFRSYTIGIPGDYRQIGPQIKGLSLRGIELIKRSSADSTEEGAGVGVAWDGFWRYLALPTPAPRKDASVNALSFKRPALSLSSDTPCIDKQIFCRAFKTPSRAPLGICGRG
ncbi:hypothetical protein TNCV_2653191 [Trichonephila clavipes]|nr:hypothetical protein TNCV_2653191 [Trichonephila clavipes]